jgi:D-glycero-D-manno-heptose 1,7-bisphosphate phosphatase
LSKIAFLDLSGTLVTPVWVSDLGELRIVKGAPAAIARLSSSGFCCPVVTVQSGIARGRFSEAQFREWYSHLARRFAAHGAILCGPYVCPHSFTEPCPCAKPNTYLYEKAAQDLGFSLPGCFVVGDSIEDIEAAHRLGGHGCLLQREPRTAGADGVTAGLPPALVANSLAEAVDWILKQAARPETVAGEVRP